MTEKKLSERVRQCDGVVKHISNADMYAQEVELLVQDGLADEIAALEQRLAEAERLHKELLMGVARKFPGETRHETALRYIKERESREYSGPGQENSHD